MVKVIDADPRAFQLDADRLAVVAVVIPFTFLIGDRIAAFEGDLQSGCAFHLFHLFSGMRKPAHCWAGLSSISSYLYPFAHSVKSRTHTGPKRYSFGIP